MEDRSRKIKYRTFGGRFAGSYESSRSWPGSSWRSEPPNCTLPKPKRSRSRCAAFGFQQIKLFTPVRQAAERDSEQPDFSFRVAMHAKEFLQSRKNIGIEPRGFSQSFGARVRFEPGVANRQCKRSRRETGFAQALASFLREMAQHG